MYKYRKLAAKDLSLLKDFFYLSLYVHEGEEAFPLSILEKPGLKKYYEEWGRTRDYGILAVCQGKAVGAVWARFFSKEEAGYGFVDEETPELGIALYEEHRGKGLGSHLIKSLLELLRAEGIKQVSLSVDRRSPALRLYQRLGFQLHWEDKASFGLTKLLKLKPCLSCAIISGKKKPTGGAIIETSSFHAHQDMAYPIPGCVIIAAKRHVYGLDELSEEEGIELIKLMQKIRKTQREVLDIEHVYYFYNEDTTHHFHVWMVPRYEWMKSIGRSVESLRPVLLYAREHMNTKKTEQTVLQAVDQLRRAIKQNG